MQKVACYLLERRDGLETPEAREVACGQCLDVVRQWLKGKGAVAPGDGSGSYRAGDGLEGKFQRESARHGGRSWELLRLDETTSDGTRHVVAVSITRTESGIAAYVTIKAGLSFSAVKPVAIDTHCPEVVRSLLDLPGRWSHGYSLLRGLVRVSGADDGERLARLVTDPKRTVPILVVSENYGSLALPDLDTKLAHDLAGLANTYAADGGASWGLTEVLGKSYSCFQGAVRLYWPRFSFYEDPFVHPLWTANRLSAYGDDPAATEELFRRQLRRLLMRASALSVLRPKEIDDIQAAARAGHLTALMERAKSGADFEQLAHAYARDNDDLRLKLAELTRRNQELAEEVEATRTRLSNAELLASYAEHDESRIEPVTPGDPEAGQGPRPQGVRFYKKTHSTMRYDVMQPVADCGCNCWQVAKSADKAKKGIARLEGYDDWRTIQHCGSCTGGGVWRVRW